MLSKVVRELFGHLGDWCVCIFDNVLIAGDSHEEICERLELFLKVAKEKNVYLKLSKTWVGFKEVKFFGYYIKNGTYRMGDDRFEAVEKVEFPNVAKLKVETCKTAMRSFLGQSRIFAPHVPDYIVYSAPLDKMTSKDFVWEPEQWERDYANDFKVLKVKLKAAMTLFF